MRIFGWEITISKIKVRGARKTKRGKVKEYYRRDYPKNRHSWKDVNRRMEITPTGTPVVWPNHQCYWGVKGKTHMCLMGHALSMFIRNRGLDAIITHSERRTVLTAVAQERAK